MSIRRRSQPRIPGVTRLPGHSALPPVVEEELQAIAARERRSVSWVKAEIVCDWFGLDAATGKVLPGSEAHARAAHRLRLRRRQIAEDVVVRFRRRAG